MKFHMFSRFFLVILIKNRASMVLVVTMETGCPDVAQSRYHIMTLANISTLQDVINSVNGSLWTHKIDFLDTDVVIISQWLIRITRCNEPKCIFNNYCSLGLDLFFIFIYLQPNNCNLL